MTARPRRALAAILLAVAAGLAVPAAAQQQVRVPVVDGGAPLTLAATLFRPAGAPGPAPAVAILHGCGGVGVNVTRMAQRLAARGYVALLVDSFGARGIRDACTRNWPTLAQAAERARDPVAAVAWLRAQPFVAADRVAVMGYSYGGGVTLMRALEPARGATSAARPPAAPLARAVIAVYPDCALPHPDSGALVARQPVLMAMAERDDWTPVAQCEALLARIGDGRGRIEAKIYPGAYHSFDAVGLPVRYLAAAGNRSKPGGCCGAHYGHDPDAYARFVVDVDLFLARELRGP